MLYIIRRFPKRATGRAPCNLAVKTLTTIMPDLSRPDDDFKPLSAQEAQQLRARLPLLSVWRVVGVQLLVAVLAAVLAAVVTGSQSVAWSVGYGGLSVVLPAALFARGMTSRLTRSHLGAAVTGFLLWELVKIGLTVAMLLAAGRWVNDLSWPALLVGFVVTMKVHWLALGVRRMFYPNSKVN